MSQRGKSSELCAIRAFQIERFVKPFHGLFVAVHCTLLSGARRLRRSLVAVQVAFAFVLLIGAGLLFASFRRILAVDPGFESTHVLTASVSLPASRYRDQPAARRFSGEVLARLRALPSVAAAGASR